MTRAAGPALGSLAACVLIALLSAAGGCAKQTAAAAAPRRAPPQFWLVESVGAEAKVRPVRLCVDPLLRTGFTSFRVNLGKEACMADHLTSDATHETYRCSVGGSEYGAATTWSQPRPDQLVVSSTLVDLETSTTVFARTLRYSLLGPCPAGWRVGEATDRQGRRVSAAFVGDTTTPYRGD
jgi:hypothetical protein